MAPTEKLYAKSKVDEPNISVKSNGNKAKVTIGKKEGASGFEIYLKSSGDTEYKKIATIKKDGSKKRKYTIKKLESGRYSVKVRAYDDELKYSGYSNVENFFVNKFSDEYFFVDPDLEDIMNLYGNIKYGMLINSLIVGNIENEQHTVLLEYSDDDAFDIAEKCFTLVKSIGEEGIYTDDCVNVIEKIVPVNDSFHRYYKGFRTFIREPQVIDTPYGRVTSGTIVLGSYTEGEDRGFSTMGGTSIDGHGLENRQIELKLTFEKEEYVCELRNIADNVKKSSKTDIGRLKYLNEYMINRFSYDYDCIVRSSSVSDLLSENKGVCHQYSCMVNYICFMVGIPCIQLYGGNHEWNLVYVNDEWKMLDVTWNDTTGKSEKYFLVDSISGEEHDWEKYDDKNLVEIAKIRAITMVDEIKNYTR
ncbi:MAG: hypothetical protein IK007_11380 [Lachnospiraceae bacterium]|nr:hypothetical protein [Lachnospiraceae bacterium]